MAASPPEMRLISGRGRSGSEPPPLSNDPLLQPVTVLLRALLAMPDEGIQRRLLDQLRPAFAVTSLPAPTDPVLYARKLRPDLIVSLLEPGSPDGPDLCRRIRSAPDLADTLLCLISVGAGSAAACIEALHAGADEVLPDTMDPEELVARLEMRVRRRRALRARYTARLAVYSREIPLTLDDVTLLQRVVDVVEAHFHEMDFRSRTLARGVGVSEAQLKRKLRALLDCSPVDLIRQRRLERAARLLALQAGNVREVAALCGFASPSYFARAFRERFGVTPSAYPPA